MLLYANLPKTYWVAAVDTAVYITNRTTSTSTDGKTPYHLWYGKIPSVSNFRTFGCPAYVINETGRKKLDPKTVKGIFVGYEKTSLSYRVYFPETNTLKASRNVTFHETFSNATPSTQVEVAELLTVPIDKPVNRCAVTNSRINNR